MFVRCFALFLVLDCVVGCSSSGPDEPLPDFNTIPLVPAGGVITLDHKPLAHAVVSFMPKHGPIATGETDETGHYTLNYGRDGAPVGDYVVAVSYLVSAEGEPQGLGPRSSLSPPPSMRAAVERLPKEYSDLGRSKMRAKVPPQGSSALNFDLAGSLLPGPAPAAEGATPAPEESPTPKS
jgi:hypothetical protein